MNDRKPNSVVVYNETEFYIAVAKLRKPIIVKAFPLDENEGIQLSEIECKALVRPLGAENTCKCCSDDLLSKYPLLIEECEGI